MKDMPFTADNRNLLGSFNRIEIPYIKVTFGDLKTGYTFGVFQKSEITKNSDGIYRSINVRFPNFVKSLEVVKINGQVNEYTLNMVYVVRPGDDPNFMEKVISSVKNTRKIYFSYGDLNTPTYIYKDEEAIITDVQTGFDIRNNKLSYTIYAVSSAKLGYSGSYTFPALTEKPSEVIKKYLRTNAYGLQEIFYGMADMRSVDYLGLIPGDDSVVYIEPQTNISIVEYIKYLVSCMIPTGSKINNNKQQSCYIMTIHDEINGETNSNRNVEILGGPYFKISKVSKNVEHSDAYNLTIGFPTASIVTSFNVHSNENYSIYYDWQTKLNQNDYALRLNDNGQWESEYAPVISSKNDEYKTRTADKVWWTKITEYPISATVTVKGLLRPAILMQYVHLDVLFFGKKHIASGTYIVTSQKDRIDESGYRTILGLTRVVGESEDQYND